MEHDIKLEDFTMQEINESYRPSFLDPGRKSVYNAAVGTNLLEHQLRRCTTSEYYHYTGSTVYLKKQQKVKNSNGIASIESCIPSPKTANASSYSFFVIYMLAHFQRLFDFYGFPFGHHRFNLYQGRQRAEEMMVNILVNGTSKYDRTRRKRSKKKKQKKKKKKLAGKKQKHKGKW